MAINLSETVAETPNVRGRIAISTNRNRDNEQVFGHLRLGRWEGAVLLHS